MRSKPCFPTVRGNHDRALIERLFDTMGSWERPAFGAISAPHLDWLRSLPMSHVVGDDIFMCHAAPEDDNFMWMEELLETGAPFACYAIIEKTKAGWQPQFRQIHYDTDRMAALAEERGYDDWALAVRSGWV